MPGLEAADDVGRIDKPELLERGGREAGRITLVAQHDDSSLGTGDRGDPPLRGGGEAPLEQVAVDDDGAGDVTASVRCSAGQMSISRAPWASSMAACSGSTRTRPRRARSRSSSSVIGIGADARAEGRRSYPRIRKLQPRPRSSGGRAFPW